MIICHVLLSPGQCFKPLIFDLHLTFFFAAVVLDDQPKMSSAMMIDEDEAKELGAKYLFVFSPLVPSKREKNILVLLSLYIF